MRFAVAAILCCFLFVLAAPCQAPPAPTTPQDYVCPMDPDVRSATPGVCPRCGMKLVLGIPDSVEYPMDLSVTPAVPRAGAPTELLFRVRDPRSGAPIEHFEIVHEKLFHMFIVSQDLSYFIHDHPVPGADGAFRFEERFPRPGLYRIGGDFYPSGATPQLVIRTVIVPGSDAPLQPAHLEPDVAPKQAANVRMELTTDPAQPIAGVKTSLFFHLTPGNGVEKYLGAWGHMLAASDDLIDMIHTHPYIAYGGPDEQFELIFPRARTYRVWVQIQREGVVNVAAFNVPVEALNQAGTR